MPLRSTEIDQLVTTYRKGYAPDVELGLRRLHERIGTPVRETPVRRLGVRHYAMAAAVLLLLGAGVVWLIRDPMVHLVNNGTELASYQLPDGTQLILQGGSDLSYDPDDFNTNQRSVHLDGQGFFEVVPDASRPFLVQNHHSTLRVTGTAFNLRTRQEIMEVEVSEGAVEITLEGEKVVVAANESALAEAGQPLIPRPAPNLNHHAWRTGELSFDQTPIDEALSYFYDNWGIECSWTDGKACDYLVSGRYRGGEAGAVLQDIATLGGAQLKAVGTTGKRYELSGPCAQ